MSPQPPTVPKTDPAKFQDQVVVVTGAASGIGHETAKYFAQQGAQVILFDINKAGLIQAQASFRDSGYKTGMRRCDVSDEDEVSASITWVAETYGKIDILANLAGVYAFRDLTDFPTELYHRHIAVNVNGGFFLTRAVLPYMQRAGYGRIVHCSSTTYANPRPGLSAYVISKAAVVGLVRAAASEAGDGVTVNAVLPGLIDTEKIKSVGFFDEMAAGVMESQTVKRQGHAIDVAYAMAFLASPEASFISGQCLNTCGGMTVSF